MKSWRMDPLSEPVPLRRLPRTRLDLACRRDSTPASPQKSRPPFLTVPFAGDDMPVAAVSLPARLEAPPGESIARKSPGNCSRLATVRSSARLPGCTSAV